MAKSKSNLGKRRTESHKNNFSKRKSRRDSFKFWTIVVIVLGILLRFMFASIAMPSGDSCWHLNVARYIGENGHLPLFEKLGRDVFARPPLFHIIGSVFYDMFSIFGDDVGTRSLNFISPLFGSLTLIFVYLISRKMFHKRVAFFTTMFMSFFPLSLYFSTISHLEATLTFFVVLSVYFILNDKLLLGAFSAGLAMLSKYNGPFIIPVIIAFLWFNRKDNASFFKRSALFIFVSGLVAAPWYIRNFIYLGNPVWPLLRFMFADSYNSAMAANISASPSFVMFLSFGFVFSRLYLGLFAVPEGNINNILAVDIPFISVAFFLWLAATVVFLIPIVIGIRSKELIKNAKSMNGKKVEIKSKGLSLLVWALSFLSVLFIFALFSGFYSRLFLPGLPVLAMLWGLGLNGLLKKNVKIFRVMFALLVLICVGFSIGEGLKTHYAASQWNFYSDDYIWVQENTQKEDIFFAPGVCNVFYVNREVYLSDFEPRFYDQFEYVNLKESGVHYLFINKEFGPAYESKFPEKLYSEFDDTSKYNLVYTNEETKTEIFELLD